MASDHGAAVVGGGSDIEAHEETYHEFVELTKTLTAVILAIILLLVLWGLEGQGGLALIGFILTVAAASVGLLTGQGWKLVAPVFVLIGLVCIVF